MQKRNHELEAELNSLRLQSTKLQTRLGEADVTIDNLYTERYSLESRLDDALSAAKKFQDENANLKEQVEQLNRNLDTMARLHPGQEWISKGPHA